MVLTRPSLLVRVPSSTYQQDLRISSSVETPSTGDFLRFPIYLWTGFLEYPSYGFSLIPRLAVCKSSYLSHRCQFLPSDHFRPSLQNPRILVYKPPSHRYLDTPQNSSRSCSGKKLPKSYGCAGHLFVGSNRLPGSDSFESIEVDSIHQERSRLFHPRSDPISIPRDLIFGDDSSR